MKINGAPHRQHTLESAWANGDDPYATGFTKGEQVGALQLGIADLKDRLGTLMPHEAVTMDETESRRWFADGRAVFMRNWPVEYASVAEKLTAGTTFDVAQLPARPSDGRRLSVARRTESGDLRRQQAPGRGPGPDRGADRPGQRTLPAGAGVRGHPRLGVPRGGEGTALPAAARRRGASGARRTGQPEPRPDPRTLHDALMAAAPRPRSAHYQTFSKVLQLGVAAYLDGSGGTAIADRLARQADDALGGRGTP